MLGGLDVRREGVDLAVGGRKPGAVLAALAIQPGQVVRTAGLIDALWPDAPPPTAVKSLQAYVSRLRKVLRPEADIESADGGYRLVLLDAVLDAAELERLAEEGRTALAGGRVDDAIDLLRRAEALWRGCPYDLLDEYEPATFERARLEELWRRVTQERIRACVARGDLEVAAELERLVTAHPLHEPFWGQLMVCLHRGGRQSDALRAYERLRQALAQELGIEPGAELQALHSAVLVGDPSLVTFPSLDLPAAPATSAEVPVCDGPAALWAAELLVGAVAVDDSARLAQAAAAVDELVEAAVAEHAGTLFERRPLAWRAVFPDAVAALRAGLVAATAMRGAVGDGLPCRGVVHVGDVTTVGGGYVGAAIRDLDRLLGVTTAGLVVSVAARDAGADAGAVEGLALAPLARSAGLPPALAAVHPDLPTASAAGRRRGPSRLPAELSSFVGREEELDALAAMAERSRLVTLCGPGGIGKTRLSLRAAATVAAEDEEVVVVELAPLDDGDLVAGAVAEAVGAPEALDGSVLDAVARHLADRPTLVVLDNCEHLVAAAAGVARELLAALPRLRILATSREPLDLPGELVLRVPPLAVPDPDASKVAQLAGVESVQLLLDRAAAARPDFRLHDANAGAVAQICERLDGIPLAVELAAARLEHLTAHEVAELLEDRFAVLVAPKGTRVERHRTLRAAIDWSHDLLSPEEQDLFARLAVFAGGWTLPAAEAVCGDAVDRVQLVDLLAALVHKSLVLVEDRGTHSRYRMLESIREYAGERLEASGHAEDVRAAHFRWCAELAARAAPSYGGPDQTAWYDRLDEERPNVVAALRWSLDGAAPAAGVELVVSLKDYLRQRCVLHEAIVWFEAAVGASDRVSARTRAKVLLALAEARFVCNHPEGWRAAAAAVEAARPVGDRRLLLDALLELGLHLRNLGRFDEAVGSVDEAVTLARDLGDERRLAGTLGRQGDLLLVAGRFDEAAALLDESATRFRRVGDDVAAGWSQASCGLALAELGERDRARIVLEDALATLRTAGSLQGEAFCQNALGHLALDDGRIDDALRCFEPAIAAYRSWGGSADLRWGLHGVAHVLQARGDPDGARRAVTESVTIAFAQASLPWVGASLCHLAAVEARCGDTVRAARLAGLAEGLRARLDLRYERVDRQRLDGALATAGAELGTDELERHRLEGEAAAAADISCLERFVLDRREPAQPATVMDPAGVAGGGR